MKTWTATLFYDFSDNIYKEYFSETTLFFDIETTGFSAARTYVYLIGCAYRRENELVITQYFSESPEEECAVLKAFLDFSKQFLTLASFNGTGFDLPYLKNKCDFYGISNSFAQKEQLDFFKIARSIKTVLNLSDYKQKTIEQFLEISRDDTFDGGKLISVYQTYVKNPNDAALSLLKLHNYEDVLGMIKLFPLISISALFHGKFQIDSVESSVLKDTDGTIQKELIFHLKNEFSLPKHISCQSKEFSFIGYKQKSKLHVRLFDGELKHFFENPKDYYYVPQSDCAVHKSIGIYMEKHLRQKANSSNCYTKKDAIFVPQYETIMTPIFQKNRKEKVSFFELTETFFESEELLFQYVLHIFHIFLSQKN